MDFLVGNAIVGQSGGPTTAINATLAGVIKGAMKNEHIGRVYGMNFAGVNVKFTVTNQVLTVLETE